MRTFYETSVLKMKQKFPFHDSTLQQLAFLDPRNRDKTSLNGILQLANRFASLSTDELDILSIEFRDYHSTPSDQLPVFDAEESGAVNHF